MDAKAAVKIAKDFVREMFADESISNLGLEEVEMDEDGTTWKVTIGFSRPWNTTRNALTTLTGETPVRRVFRVVRVDDHEHKAISMTRRDDPES